jgi:hypothetical protein
MAGKKQKVTLVERAQQTANVMLGIKPGDKWADFPLRVVVVKSMTDDPIFYVRSDDNVFARISEDALESIILEYWSGCAAMKGQSATSTTAKQTLEFFHAYSESFSETIYPVRFLSQPGNTFHRLDFDLQDGATPTFDEMLSRASNAQAIMAYIGSMFEAESEMQQYLYIYGEGRTGKSRLPKILMRIFRDSACASYAHHMNQFWTSQFMNKRFAYFPDCDNPNFVTSGLWKSMIGGDPVRVEFKGQAIHSVQLFCKFLIVSNNKPNIESDVASLRRVIFSEFKPFDNERIPDAIYDALLWSEVPKFIKRCLEVYREVAPRHGAIPTEGDVLAEVISHAEERWAAAVERYMDVWPRGYFDPVDNNKAAHMLPTVLQTIIKSEGWSQKDATSFRDYLKRVHNVYKKKIKLQSRDAVEVYLNCKSKDDKTDYSLEAIRLRAGRDQVDGLGGGKLIEITKRFDEIF